MGEPKEVVKEFPSAHEALDHIDSLKKKKVIGFLRSVPVNVTRNRQGGIIEGEWKWEVFYPKK